MSLTPDGWTLLNTWEGCRLSAYPDPASGGAPWTIGYGHTGPDVHPGLTISQQQAEAWLQSDVAGAASSVDRLLTGVVLTPRQRDALISFCFNVGAGALERSTLRRRLLTGEAAAIVLREELPRWCQGRLLVLCDDLDPDGGAIELIQQLRQRHGAHRCRFLVCLHSTIHQERLERIWRCGVDGLSCLDHCGNGHILQTLLILMRGLTCMDPLFTQRLRRLGAEALEHQLEERDLQLIQALARGRSCREIAALWQLRYDSVRRLLSSLYHRVGVRN